ncbi:hypothetical protein NC651_011367 [Populus alba x Populus x berolinensis]|nr:hypothetical protein NC651_011367 [Populus alba x Populus x berolinensis]
MASPNCGPRGLTELITWLLAAGCTWLPCRRTRPATAFVGGHDRGAEVAGHLRLFRPERALVSLGVPFRPRSKELKPTDWELLGPWQGFKIAVPTKFIAGDKDVGFVSFGTKDCINGEIFKEFVPNVEVVVIDGHHFISRRKLS